LKWSEAAAGHVARGDTALASGAALTAAEAFIRAGLFYHWANFMFTHDQAQFSTAFTNMAECWRKAAPHLNPGMEILAVDFESVALPGYLQLPNGIRNPPLILLLPGADSNKE